jgi:hypothetical protein
MPPMSKFQKGKIDLCFLTFEAEEIPGSNETSQN